LYTGTPSSRSACRMPSRLVICSRLPPAMPRTSAARGRLRPKPGITTPWGIAVVSKRQSARSTQRPSKPRRASAWRRRLVCQPVSSVKMATRAAEGAPRTSPAAGAARASPAAPPGRSPTGTLPIGALPCIASRLQPQAAQQVHVQPAAVPGAAAVEVADPHLGGREQRRIDLVEVVLVVAEDVAERAPVVARGGRRQALRQVARGLVAAAHLQV